MERTLKTIKRLAECIVLVWSDGAEQAIAHATLRRQCPCAECREQRAQGSATAIKANSALKIVSAGLEEELQLVDIKTIGNYAIALRWADGHDAGIYTYNFLAKL
jgi:DUF971 family protein